MKRILVALSVICFWCLPVPAQSTKAKAPQKPQAKTPAASAQNGAPKTNVPPANAPQTARISGLVPPPATEVPEDFIIGPEDILEIRVWKEPDLTTRAIVRPDGKIGVTLLGDVQASGLTTAQMRDSVAEKLSRFVEDPEVSVVVVEIHSQMVHLIGLVGRPGAYALGGPLTVMELLARAGGLSLDAKGEIAITRYKAAGVVERIPFDYKAFVEGKDIRHNLPLKNGDVVIVR